MSPSCASTASPRVSGLMTCPPRASKFTISVVNGCVAAPAAAGIAAAAASTRVARSLFIGSPRRELRVAGPDRPHCAAVAVALELGGGAAAHVVGGGAVDRDRDLRGDVRGNAHV